MSDAQLLRSVTRGTAKVECLTCNSVHSVTCGEDGGGAISQTLCQHPGCTAMLCTECRRECGECRSAVCEEHLVAYSGGHWCAACIAGDVTDAGAEVEEAA